MQCILSALVAIIIALAPVFNIPLTVVPPKGELPHESEPAPSELSVYDKVVGVDDSVFYISRPNAENMKIIYASDFGMDSTSAKSWCSTASAGRMKRASECSSSTPSSGRTSTRAISMSASASNSSALSPAASE